MTGGKSSVRTRTKRSSGNVDIDEQFVFHRSGARQQFILEIWEDKKMMRDKLLGTAAIVALIDNDSR